MQWGPIRILILLTLLVFLGVRIITFLSINKRNKRFLSMPNVVVFVLFFGLLYYCRSCTQSSSSLCLTGNDRFIADETIGWFKCKKILLDFALLFTINHPFTVTSVFYLLLILPTLVTCILLLQSKIAWKSITMVLCLGLPLCIVNYSPLKQRAFKITV